MAVVLRQTLASATGTHLVGCSAAQRLDEMLAVEPQLACGLHHLLVDLPRRHDGAGMEGGLARDLAPAHSLRISRQCGLAKHERLALKTTQTFCTGAHPFKEVNGLEFPASPYIAHNHNTFFLLILLYPAKNVNFIPLSSPLTLLACSAAVGGGMAR